MTKKVKLLHVGWDYASIEVNGFEYEVWLDLICGLWKVDVLEFSEDIDQEAFKDFINRN